MMKIRKKAWIEIGVVSAVFVALALIAAFFDLQINKALYAPDTLFGQFFQKLGEFPAYLAAPFVGVVFFYQDFGNNKKQKLFWKTACALLAFGGWFFALAFWFWGSFMAEIPYAVVYQITLSALLTAALLFSCIKVDRAFMKQLFLFAVFAAVVIALSNAVVQVMKVVWARQRFRTMVANEHNAPLIAAYGGDYGGFTPWYRPNLLFRPEWRTEVYEAAHKALDGDSFKSFPSGHTVGAAASFAIILLPDVFDKLKKYKKVFWIAPAVYTGIVAISRIVMGAHYLSDVLFGGFIGFGIAALARFLLLSHTTKKETQRVSQTENSETQTQPAATKKK